MQTTVRFVCVLLITIIGIFAFTSGFLLSKAQLKLHSQTVHVPTDDRDQYKAPFSRALVLVLDALRLDFIVEQPYSQRPAGHVELMQDTRRMIDALGPAAVFSAFTADPPTTTMQRLKALLTGSLPTFLDVGSVFTGGAIEEDNLFYQAVQHGLRVGFVGDDTWLQLFPQTSNITLSVSIPFPSLNVKDLHSVDDGVSRVLREDLISSEDWGILVAHYLGIDHAGHTFNVASKEMHSKVLQMDKELVEIVSTMVNMSGPGDIHEHTLLIVMGDHGQTMSGDHGGGSDEEVDSAIIAVNLAAASKRHGEDEESDSHMQQRSVLENTAVIDQLDFAASISALLGLPQPFESVDAVRCWADTSGAC